MKPKARIRKLEKKQKPTEEDMIFIIERDDGLPHEVLFETDNGGLKFIFLGPQPKETNEPIKEAQNDNPQK